MNAGVRSSDVLDLVAEVENRWPVQQWRIDGIRVWPLIRVRVYTAALNQGLAAEPVPSTVARLWRRATDAVRLGAAVVGARLSDGRAQARTDRRADVLFLSDGVSFVRVGGLWSEKFYDPIVDAIAERGGSFLMLTPLDRLHRPRRSPSHWIQPELDAAKAFAGRVRVDPAGVRLDGCEDVMEHVRRRGFAAAALSERDILGLWRRLRAEERVFARYAERARPQRAFVNTYYSIEGMAFVLACRRAGVPVADVQHGYQGDHHVAYGRWAHVPPEGYELLPDEFWVWSDRERACIDGWRPAGRHAPVVTGNMWLDWWRDGEAELVVRTVSDVERQLVRPGRRHVLVTLPWGIPWDETALILDAAMRAPRDWLWWFRVHPLVAAERAGLKAQAARRGLDNVFVDEPTEQPLHALLRLADVHVTHSSTTVLEAAEFGLHSVITSTYGAEFFADEIEHGRAVLATTPDAIAAAVAAAPARRAVRRRTSDDGWRALIAVEGRA